MFCILLKFIFKWKDEDEKTLKISTGSEELTVPIYGSNEGLSYIPLRQISEGMNKSVYWDGEKRTIDIESSIYDDLYDDIYDLDDDADG